MVFAYYQFYFVGRWGKTPGKMVVRIRIVDLDLKPVRYKQAFWRESVGILFLIVSTVGECLAINKMSSAEFHDLGWMALQARQTALNPLASWFGFAGNCWFWGELIFLLTNRKRRALHDFIAGTVVIREDSSGVPLLESEGAYTARTNRTKLFWKCLGTFVVAVLLGFVVLISYRTCSRLKSSLNDFVSLSEDVNRPRHFSLTLPEVLGRVFQLRTFDVASTFAAGITTKFNLKNRVSLDVEAEQAIPIYRILRSAFDLAGLNAIPIVFDESVYKESLRRQGADEKMLSEKTKPFDEIRKQDSRTK